MSYLSGIARQIQRDNFEKGYIQKESTQPSVTEMKQFYLFIRMENAFKLSVFLRYMTSISNKKCSVF